MTPHNEAKLGDIAKIVLMPGDPLRAKYIADNFLDNVKLVNSIRGMYAYTGTYKGCTLTVMASGMGIPSMGIYCYELYHYYNVEKIIRIGSCGAYIPELKLLDIVLIDTVYSESNFALTLNNDNCHLVNSDKELTNTIAKTADELNIKYYRGTTLCSDCFDKYITDLSKLFARMPKNLKIAAAEMESFALFYTAKILNKKAACLITVVDTINDNESVPADTREKSLNNMIKLALESAIKNI